MTRIKQVVCPVDFSDTSRHALDQAAAIARWYEAGLTVVYGSGPDRSKRGMSVSLPLNPRACNATTSDATI